MEYKSHAKIVGYSDTTKICARAARISTTKGNALDIYNKEKSQDEDSALIEKVISSGHKSFIEHAVFNIAFCNVSAVVEQFIIEFRLLSLTIKSRRYVNFGEMGYYVPSYFPSEHMDIYKDHMNYLFDEYNYLLSMGIPKEDARFVLPYSFCSNFYCTVNARELIHLLREIQYGRGNNFAELQDLARQLCDQIKEIMPCILHELNQPPLINKIDTIKPPLYERGGKLSKIPSVKLLSATPDISRNVIISYLVDNDYPITNINDILSDSESTNRILKEISRKQRSRELEQVNLTYLVNGISLSGITHIIRHRMQSLVIPSMAYVNIERYITPQTIIEQPELKKRYDMMFSKTAMIYESMIKQGYNIFELSYYALSGNQFDIMTTMNARELRLFVKLRACNRAQWEIRDIAKAMLNLAREKSPELFANLGPNCFIEGVCPEGRLTCGKMDEVKSLFGVTIS